MAIKSLTKRAVDALRAAQSEYFVWDDALTGFGLKVAPTGRKTYVVQYRVRGEGRGGFARRLTLGQHGALTPDEARDLARKELGRVADGLNPVAVRKAKKAEREAARAAAVSVAELGKRYLADVQVRRKERTAKEYARLWERHVIPALGSRAVAEIRPPHLRRLHHAMHETPYLANRVLALLGAFFTFAAAEGFGGANPAHGIEPYPEHSRERFLTAAEFTRLGKVLARAEREGLPVPPKIKKLSRGMSRARRAKLTGRKRRPYQRTAPPPAPSPANPLAVAAIRLLMLTGCREREVLSLRWDAVDFERGHLRLEDTKTGRSVRPLGASAAELLKSLPRVDGSPYVFPGAKEGTHLQELGRLWYAVRHEAKLDELRLHDLRHSFASMAAIGGESMLVLRAMLGHMRMDTTLKYAHLSDDPVKRAADRTAGDIAAALGGSATPVRRLGTA